MTVATLRRGALAAATTAATLPALLVLLLAITILGPPDEAPAGEVSAVAVDDIPPAYLRLYITAAARYRLDWAILAAVGKIETDHGRGTLPGVRTATNDAGAAGPMQFLPSTWQDYGVDGDHNGRRDVYDPADAIPAAARYLRASGAPADYPRAIFAYNHAGWYVDAVLEQARDYRDQAGQTPLLDVGDGSRLAKLLSAADQLDRARVPYCYGGGHATTPARPSRGSYCWHEAPARKLFGSPDAGLDCSGSVSLVLQAAGYDLPTMTSGRLATWGEPGPGRHVTIWANAEHAYLEIGERYWGTSAENHRHGPGWHSPRSSTGFTARHPPGL